MGDIVVVARIPTCVLSYLYFLSCIWVCRMSLLAVCCVGCYCLGVAGVPGIASVANGWSHTKYQTSSTSNS